MPGEFKEAARRLGGLGKVSRARRSGRGHKAW